MIVFIIPYIALALVGEQKVGWGVKTPFLLNSAHELTYGIEAWKVPLKLCFGIIDFHTNLNRTNGICI